MEVCVASVTLAYSLPAELSPSRTSWELQLPLLSRLVCCFRINTTLLHIFTIPLLCEKIHASTTRSVCDETQ